jgi:hypothetical protein
MDQNYQLESLPEPKPFAVPTLADYDPRHAALEAQRASMAAASSQRNRAATGGGSGGTSSNSNVSLAEMQAKVAATMQKMFWARLVSSLTPTSQRSASDFVVGSVVQARYGGAQGTFYAAEVTAVHSSSSAAVAPTFDIKYAQDGVVELRCPLSQFRLASEPVDARPLMSLIGEVRQRLEGATPKRTDLHAHYRQVLDSEWLTQMLLKGVLEPSAMLKLAHFLLDAVAFLEAPARAQRTTAFKDAFTAFVTQPDAAGAAAAGGSGGGSGGSNGNSSSSEASSSISPFVRALPSFFTFLHVALDQLQRDKVNFQVSMLAPRFAGEQGVLYERRRFDDKLSKGQTTLQKTELWLGSAVEDFCSSHEAEAAATGSAQAAGGGVAAAGEVLKSVLPKSFAERRNALASASAPFHGPCVRALVATALVDNLISKPVRWDSPEVKRPVIAVYVCIAQRLRGRHTQRVWWFVCARMQLFRSSQRKQKLKIYSTLISFSTF